MPTRHHILDPAVFDYNPESVYYKGHDGTRLHAWKFKSRKGPPLATILHFHGNGQNISSHFISVAWLTHHGFDLITVDYRGYGMSEGQATAEDIHKDSVAVLDSLHASLVQKNQKMIIYGQSLGGAITLRAVPEMASTTNLIKVYVEGAFHSYQAVAYDKAGNYCIWPITIGLSKLVSDDYSPSEHINRIAPIPLHIIHGSRDPIISVEFAREVFNKATEPKQLTIIPGGGHINWLSYNAAPIRIKILKEMLDETRKFKIGDRTVNAATSSQN